MKVLYVLAGLLPISLGFLIMEIQNGLSSVLNWNLLLTNIIGMFDKGHFGGYMNPTYSKVVTSLMLANPVLFGIIFYRYYWRMKSEF